MTPDRLSELEDIQNANCPCVECAGIRELVAEVRRLMNEHREAHVHLTGKGGEIAWCMEHPDGPETEVGQAAARLNDEVFRLRARVAELEARQTKSVEKKSDRRCNNPECGRRLTEDAPNWFQCSEECRAAVWRLNNPPKPNTYED